MRHVTCIVTGLLCLLVQAAATADTEPASADTEPAQALERYVRSADANFAWREHRTGTLEGSTWVELRMTSQSWRGHAWEHQLYLIRPSTLDPHASTALLMIDGGSRYDLEDSNDTGDGSLPRRASLFAGMAELIGAPVAVLRQVPNQPLFDGLTEDELISKTFEAYLASGDAEWPLLLPMVNSAVRAMDAVQAYTGREWALDIDRFTLTGASKRGWTTWLTAAVDTRVAALAPMVIDMLNIPRHLALSESVWGEPAEQIAPYTERGLQDRLDSPEGRALLQIVDPYSYRDRLQQPKLIILGTNDPYWPLQSIKLYWSDLEGENRLLYLPNDGHRLRDYERVIGGVAALHRGMAGDTPLPRLHWTFESGAAAEETVTLRADPAPTRVRAWTASSATADLRDAEWSSTTLEFSDGEARHVLRRSGDGYRAVFLEAEYAGAGPVPLRLSTTPRVLEPLAAEDPAVEDPAVDQAAVHRGRGGS